MMSESPNSRAGMMPAMNRWATENRSAGGDQNR